MSLGYEERQALRKAIDRRQRERCGIDACEFALARLLAQGPRPAAEVWPLLADEGYGRETILRAVNSVTGSSKSSARQRRGTWAIRPGW